ncbi:Hypp2143 [Branchiostoma lanceolatum]|uniref:Hypp2143 protein n=1 Tax=Branchiostoma lanceolatum TaxID=7740 RepID=A0A8K0EP40_BRALA|nr:Hypp2143 [Branchiostoma lanceolatum]
MTTESKEEVSSVELRMKQSQGEAAFSSHLRRDTASVHWQETLNALHRECNDLLELTQQQAKVSEDDLARSSFKIAELEILLADYKLRADDAKVRHERSAQKNRQITDLKAQVAALKAGGDCRDEVKSAVEAMELSDFRIAELEILLEEKRDENTMLRAQLLSQEEKRLTAEMLSSSSVQEQEMGNSGGLGQSVLRKAGKTLSLIDKLRRSSVPRKHEKVLFKIGKKFLGLVVTAGSKIRALADRAEHQPNTSRPISDPPSRAEFGWRSRTPADSAERQPTRPNANRASSRITPESLQPWSGESREAMFGYV